MINKLIPIRMDPNEELLGADLMEHRIRHSQIGLSRALSALQPLHVDLTSIVGIPPIGSNPRHDEMLQEIRQANDKINQWHAYYDHMTPKKSSRSRTSMKSGGILLRSAGNLFNRRRNMKNKQAAAPVAAEGVNVPGTFVSTKDDQRKVASVSAYFTPAVESTQSTTVKPEGSNNFAWVD